MKFLKVVKFRETESGTVVSRDWGRGIREMGSCCSVDAEFQILETKCLELCSTTMMPIVNNTVYLKIYSEGRSHVMGF